MTRCVLPFREALSQIFPCCHSAPIMPLVDNFDAIVCQLVDGGPRRAADFRAFLAGVCFALIFSHTNHEREKKRHA